MKRVTRAKGRAKAGIHTASAAAVPNVWIIQGGPNTRKSSVIRCLTGLARRNQNPYDIQLLPRVGGGYIPVYVVVSALQEPAPAQTPQQFVAFITQHRHMNVLVCLRIQGTPHCQYDAVEYHREFVAAGWNIQDVVTLGPYPGSPPAAPQNVAFPAAPNAPANSIARRIRTRWQWA